MQRLANECLDDNLLEIIQRTLPDLRKSDRRVAETLLKDPLTATEMTLDALAQASGVSAPTVLRFCTAIGCEGMRDLRLRLARSLVFARSTSHTAISSEDDLATIVTKIFDFNLSNLTWVRNHLDLSALSRAIKALSSCHRIEFFGFGASAIVARDAQQKFPLFGVPCGAASDGHQMIMTAAMLKKGDVVVAISNTGTTREVIEATKLAHSQGACTIGITGSKSCLLDQCDIGLIVEILENTNLYTPTISRVAALVVIDILSAAVSLGRGQAHHAQLSDMKQRLAKIRTTGQYEQSNPT